MKNLARPTNTLAICFLLLLAYDTSAQKLPNIQLEPVYAPASIKIDGDAKEWNGGFQAYNKATLVYYTIANDDNDLYLTIQAVRPDVIEKILAGAITINIKSKLKGEKSQPLSLTYPNIDRIQKSAIVLLLKNKNAGADTLVRRINQKMAAASKEIKLSGFDGITDSEISVYNENGIKTAATIGSKREWTCELAIPLKYLKHIANTVDGSFYYQLIVNGVQLPGGKMLISGGQLDGNDRSGEAPLDFFSPTDFTASYTFVKK